MPILLYAFQITSRLQFVAAFISKELFTHNILLTTSKARFCGYGGPKINYSHAALTDTGFHLQHTDLLFEKGISSQEITCFETHGCKAFFQTAGGDFPFDVFAAVFYLISRYEEYLPHQKDAYGRYAHTHSLAFREGFLHLPLVNIWLCHFQEALRCTFPSQVFRRRRFRYVPTYDIDIAYSYLSKGWWRNSGGLVRSVIKGEWSGARERLAVLARCKKDPFDVYEWLDALHLYCRVKPCYFFLVAGRQTGYDKNISPYGKALQQLIRYHASGYSIGIHPSWQSGDDEQLLKEELDLLEYFTDKTIIQSRQHYIRLTLPVTYQKLLASGITRDYSMGYGSINGFRASVASSFYWYDLTREEATRLLVYPFCFMDANAYYEQKLTPGKAFEELMHFYHAVKKVNGLMITIWHNNFLGTAREFAGWKEAYEIFLREEVYWD